MVLKGVCKSHEQSSSSLQAVNRIIFRDLQAVGHGPDIEFPQSSTVHLTWFEWIAREDASFEHLQAGDGQTLTASVYLTRLFAPVMPLRAGAGVEEDGY